MSEINDFTTVHGVNTYELAKSGQKIKTGTFKDFMLDYFPNLKEEKLIFIPFEKRSYFKEIKQSNPDAFLITTSIFGDNISLENLEEINFLINFRNSKELKKAIEIIKPEVIEF